MNGLLIMLFYLMMMFVIFYFWIKACHKTIKYLTHGRGSGASDFLAVSTPTPWKACLMGLYKYTHLLLPVHCSFIVVVRSERSAKDE